MHQMSDDRLTILEELLKYKLKKYSLDCGMGDPENMPVLLIKPTISQVIIDARGLSITKLRHLTKQWREWAARVDKKLDEVL